MLDPRTANAPKPADVAVRVRVELARRLLPASDVAVRIGMSPRAFRKRCRGEVPFEAGEIGLVALALGMSADAFVLP